MTRRQSEFVRLTTGTEIHSRFRLQGRSDGQFELESGGGEHTAVLHNAAKPSPTSFRWD